jgi:hypothetical protein
MVSRVSVIASGVFAGGVVLYRTRAMSRGQRKCWCALDKAAALWDVRT